MLAKRGSLTTLLFGIAALCLLPVHCTQSPTAELLNARALANGEAPPQLIAPTDGEHVPLTVLLRFSGQSVNIALLEIATDSSFTSLVVRTRVSVGAQTLSLPQLA